jgi:nascent polypeptide-associated complex subunit alpha
VYLKFYLILLPEKRTDITLLYFQSPNHPHLNKSTTINYHEDKPPPAREDGQEDGHADEVVIKAPNKEIVIHNPSVAKVNMMGQETFQISGDVEEREKQGFSEEDVGMVAEKAGVSQEQARAALQRFGGIAEAILGLKDEH